MLAISFVDFVRQQGLETREIVGFVAGGAMLLTALLGSRQTLRLMQAKQPITRMDVVGPFIGLVAALGMLVGGYAVVYGRYLLRDGAVRFTLGHIYKYGSMRGESQLVYDYYVAEQRYQSAQACGELRDPPFPCLPVGTRCFVRFSPERPTTAQLLARPVPDTLRYVPAAGWSRLP